MDQSYMRTRKVFPLVFTTAMPMVLSMFVNALYNIIDSFFIAKISEDAMTAISLVFPLQNLVGAISIGFGIGVNAAVAFFLGKGERERAEDLASMSLILSILHGVLVTVGCLLVLRSFLSSFGAEAAIMESGMKYARIVLLFSVVISMELVYEKLYQAVGSMTVSMSCMMAGCIVNIILDPMMIFGVGFIPAMGIEGAALATGIGQTVTLVIYIVLYLRGRLGMKLSFNPGKRDWKLAGRIYSVGIPATLSQALPSVLISLLNKILAPFPGSGVLILGIYYKLQTFIYLTANGIVQGIRPLVGYNYGAGDLKRVRKIYKTALYMAMVVMGVGTLLCLMVPDVLMGMFTENAETIRQGSAALRTICLGFIVSAVSITVSGTLEGMGRGVESLVIMLLRYLAVIVPTAFLLSRWFGAAGVWNAFWITEVAAMLVSLMIYRRSIGNGNSGASYPARRKG